MERIQHLYAVSYQTYFPSGKTKPCVFLCNDENNKSQGEYVVKLRSSIQNGNSGLLNEVLSSQLAQLLDISVPKSAIISIDSSLADAIPDEQISQSVRKSAGLNFGSKNMSGGYTSWPIAKNIPGDLRQKALDVFIFDMFIQNPDRRREKPNLLWKNDELIVIDHEMAFSFLLAVPQASKPWILDEGSKLIRDHVFILELKKSKLNFDRITGAIESITDSVWQEIENNIPIEWKNDDFQKIHRHINSIKDHIDDFINEIRRVLQ